MLLQRLGALVHRRARLVLTLTGILLVAAAVIGVGAFGKLQGGGFDDPNSASTRAANQLSSSFGGQNNLVFLVRATAAGTDVDSPAVQAAGEKLTSSLA